MELKDAVSKLIGSYGDIRREGSTMVVDAYEAKEALENAPKGSAEELVLQILVNANPIPEVLEIEIKKAKKKASKIEEEVETTEDALRAAE